MRSALRIMAGPDALAELRDGGLSPGDIRIVVGASGGPKWLVLHGLDRVLFPWLADRSEVLHAVGSSIGSWRFACLASRDPIGALERFAEAYVEQRYVGRPTPAEVSREGDRIMDRLLGAEGVTPLVENAKVLLHVVAARFLHLGASEGRAQLLGLGLAALANLAHRRALSAFIERVVFDSQADPGPFTPWQMLPTRHVPLTADNVRAALSASAAIPRVMSGVSNPAGAPPGVYRDGGVADYHFGREIDPREGYTLYPHFFPYLVPGWFDKSLSWRRTRGLRRVVVLCPSADFVRGLPHGRIPDRQDFIRLRDAERIAAWKTVLTESARLGDEFGELVSSGRIGRRVEPLDGG